MTTQDAPLPELTERVREEDEELGEKLESALESFNEARESARQQLEQVNHKAIVFIQEQPVIALAAAFGAGYLLGSLAARRWII